MSKNLKIVVFAALVLLGGALGGWLTGGKTIIEKVKETSFQGISNLSNLALGSSFSGTLPDPGSIVQNGTAQYVSSGSCNDATTTLFAVANPFAATSTVDFTKIDITNGTTTGLFYVGTTTAPTASSLAGGVSPSLVAGASIATSTLAYVVNGQKGSGAEFPSAGASSLDRIVVGPSQYVIGVINPTATGADTSGVTGNSNTFSCSYSINWIR